MADLNYDRGKPIRPGRLFMGNKASHRKQAFFCLLLAISFSFVCTACQPTPEVPPLVNRAGGLPDGAVIEAIPAGETKHIDAPLKWVESVDLAIGNTRLNADVGIQCPEISNTPVLVFRQVAFSDAQLEKVIWYFLGDSELYKVSPLSKTDLQALYDDVENEVGTFGMPGLYGKRNAAMSNLEDLMEKSSEPFERQTVKAAYTYPDPEKETDILSGILGLQEEDTIQSDNTFQAYADTGGLFSARIDSTRYDPKTGSSSNIKIQNGVFYTEEKLKDIKENYDMYWSMRGTTMENLLPFKDQWFTDESAWIEKYDSFIEEIPLDAVWALSLAEKTLNDLSMDGFGLDKCIKGVRFLTDDDTSHKINKGRLDFNTAEGGYEFVFFKESAGLLACELTNGYYRLTEPDGSVPNAPPFFTESIRIFVTEDGVQKFDWQNAAEQVGVVAENTKLLPFEEIKRGFLNHINYNAFNGGYRIDVKSVELRLAYTPAFNTPINAWLIPVWVFAVDWYSMDDSSGIEYYFLEEQCQFSALDGGYVASADASTVYSAG